jgi:hypothetical protein
MDEFELARSDWPAYFELLSAEGAGARTSVHVLPMASVPGAASSLGWSLHACTYDLDSEVLELALRGEGSDQPGLRCFVSEPRSIYAHESHADRVILIADAQAVRTLVCLRPRLPRRPHCRPGARRRRESAPAAARSSRSEAHRPLRFPAPSDGALRWS